MGPKKLKLTTSPPVLLRNLLRVTCRVSMLHLLIHAQTLARHSSLDGADDSQVASAAAQDAVQSPADIRLRWMGVFVKQHFGIHNHAVHAVPALRRLLVNERLLEPVRMG